MEGPFSYRVSCTCTCKTIEFAIFFLKITLTIQFDANSSSHELIGQIKTKNMCPYYANGSKQGGFLWSQPQVCQSTIFGYS